MSLVALAGALALALLVALPAPAQAHDTLLESDPADGDVLATSPEAITLNYSADVLDVSPLVRISDADGTAVAEITPTIDGPVATATLPEPLEAGDYEVAWRVVSSDGHPIEGTFAITVEQDPAAEETGEPAASDAGGATATEDTAASDAGGAEDPAAEDSPAGQAQDEPASGASMPLLLGILGVIVVAAVVAGVVIVRRRD